MSESRSEKETTEAETSWLAGHIGRLAGGVLGLAAIAFLAFLAVLGFAPALGVLIVVVAGVAMISLGGAMRGGR